MGSCGGAELGWRTESVGLAFGWMRANGVRRSLLMFLCRWLGGKEEEQGGGGGGEEGWKDGRMGRRRGKAGSLGRGGDQGRSVGVL